ncbi:MAG: ATP-binding cassette domain-containing protein [Planctomycetia bacterium]
MIRFDRASVERGGQLVVEAVSAEWPTGSAVAIVGRGGAGKSSLVAAAATALPLHGGDVLVAGASVRRDPEAVRRLAGYVPTALPAWPGLRAAEFLELFATTAGLQGRPLALAVERALDLAGLAGQGGVALETLAAAPAKMLLVARALLHEPQVLLCDDPFAGLDPAGRARVVQLVGDACLMGRTVVAAIDDAEVPGCFTHVAVLAEGRLVAAGPADPAAFLGRTWAHRLVCPGRAAEAVRAIGPLVETATVVDADVVACRHDPARGSFADVVAAAVRAGIPVAAAGHDPPWAAQLLD